MEKNATLAKAADDFPLIELSVIFATCTNIIFLYCSWAGGACLLRPELQTPGTGGADAIVTPQPAPAASDKPEITSTVTAEATTKEDGTSGENNATTTEDKDQDATANDGAGKPAVALFDFEPNAEDELQLKAGKFGLHFGIIGRRLFCDQFLVVVGQEVTVLVQNDKGGWWEGEANGKIGLFPASYVKLQC